MASAASNYKKLFTLHSARIAAAALLLGFLSTQSAQALPPDFDDFVNSLMRKYNVPGVAVTIVDGKNVFAKGYGVRSVGKPGAVDADTIFMLASNPKPFTA